MKEYLLGIIAAAFLLSLLNALGGSGAGQGMRRLIGGLLLALAVFRPLGNFNLDFPNLSAYQKDAQAAISDGIAQAEEAKTARITEALRAYILTKAAPLGLKPEVEVELGEDGSPLRIILRAGASPGERQTLTGILVRELGLEKEAVAWIESYQSSESTTSSEHTNIPS